MRARLALALVVLVALATLTGCIRDFDAEHPNRLHVRGIDVAAPEVTSGSIVLLVNTTLDNSLAASGEVRLVVKAYDTQTGFLTLTRAATPGTIDKDRTVSVPVLLEVPRAQGYRIEVWLYQDDQLIQTAQVTVHNVAALKPTRWETGLRFDGIDFLVREVTNATVRIEAQTILTNTGASDSRPLTMELKARDLATRLLGDETERDVPSIAPEATRELPATLEVPSRRNYEVEVTLWDGNVTVGKGTGLVQLLPTIEKPKDTELVVTDPRIEDFIRGGGPPGSSASRGASDSFEDRFSAEDAQNTPFPAGVAALAVLALAALAHRRWRR